jgi:hypothetical protein
VPSPAGKADQLSDAEQPNQRRAAGDPAGARERHTDEEQSGKRDGEPRLGVGVVLFPDDDRAGELADAKDPRKVASVRLFMVSSR